MALSRDEFSSLVLPQLDSLYRIALRLARKPADAEDLVQETYYRALRSWQTYRPETGAIRPWLVRILRNTFLTRATREGKQPKATPDEHLDSSPATPALPPASPERFAQYMDEELVKAMDGLPDDYRTVLILWALEDFSYQEIADALEIPIGTVMSRLHRARAKLSETLREYAKREGILRE